MILIADDNENDALVLLDLLKSAGVKNPITMVGDGREVISYFKGADPFSDRANYPIPNVLLLDLKMPKIGGFDVLEWLKLAMPTKDILIVILSGYAELENIKRGYELGARSFLPKPCRREDIQNLIRAYSTYWQMESTPNQTGGAIKSADKQTPFGP